MRGPGQRLHWLVIVTHRYIGIPLSVVFVIWFFSGIVMMYTGGMPRDSVEESRSHQAVIPLSDIALTPSEAATRASATPNSASLRNLLRRPAYIFQSGRGQQTVVFADTGETIDGVGPEAGREIISIALDIPQDRVRFVRTLQVPDQWTLTPRRQFPLHRYDVDDSFVYVSATTGEIILTASRTERMIAWAGAIPHWFYVTPLRINQPAWFWTVVIASGIGCLVAALGLVLMFTQFHKSKPFSLQKSIRYRGWMRWHYYSGVLFGVVTLTWVFSGLLSMGPFDWMNTEGTDVDA